MTATKTLIEKFVLTEDAASVTFSNIPQTYTDLMIVASIRSSNADSVGYAGIRFNGDEANNYDIRYLSGNGSGGPGSNSFTSTNRIFGQGTGGNGSTSNTFSSIEIYVPNYLGSTNKSVSMTNMNETNSTVAYMTAVAGLWKNTSAITSATIVYPGYNLLTNSSFYLYGIQASPNTPILTQGTQTVNSTEVIISNYDANLTYTASSSAGTASVSGNAITVSGLSVEQTVTVTVSAVDSNGYTSASASGSFVSALALSGGTITESGGYRYHTFTSSSALTVNAEKSVEYLVVAGGGSSAQFGGGGAGGMITGSGLSLTTGSSPYIITIGAGGGSNSSAFGHTAIGGGGGGGYGGAGGSGGSGGGGGANNTTGFAGGSGTSGQGNPGGSGAGASNSIGRRGGGGGGAGGSGGNASPFSASAAGGGAGLSWNGTVYSSGGDGGGGGLGGSNLPGGANSGDGGNAQNAGGGSGIVIIRYAI